MLRMRMKYTVAFLAASGLMISFAGCGAGGGASTKPTITVKPAESTAGGGGTEEDDNGGPAPEGYGTLTGTITFDGTPPNLSPIVAKGQAGVKDAEICAAEPVPDQSLVVDSATKGIANVFIYLDRAPRGAKVPAVPEEPVVFDQKGCLFMPHALVVRVGQPLTIKSSDPIAHNTNTRPLANQPKNFLLKANDPGGDPLVYTLSEKQPFKVVCDIHPWMLAYHMTLDHPYMAVTAEDGTFEIKNVPAGTHTFRIWHETGGFLSRSEKVTIKPDEPNELKPPPFGADKFAKFDGPQVKQVVLSLK